MQGQSLFDITAETHHIELFLGEYDCDVPFGGGKMECVSVSLTTDSPRSRHGIPVLRLQGGHQMDFAAHEQTPAGHAAKLVADWLEHHNPVNEIRHVAHFLPTLIARVPELQAKLKDALSTNNRRLTESCREALQAIEAINKSLQGQPLESEGLI